MRLIFNIGFASAFLTSSHSSVVWAEPTEEIFCSHPCCPEEATFPSLPSSPVWDNTPGTYANIDGAVASKNAVARKSRNPRVALTCSLEGRDDLADDTLYMAAHDESGDARLTVLELDDNGAWNYVGGSRYVRVANKDVKIKSNSGWQSYDIQVNNQGEPCVVLVDDNDSKPKVFCLSGGSWNELGASRRIQKDTVDGDVELYRLSFHLASVKD